MWWTAADGGSLVGTAGEEGLPSCISTLSQLMCSLAVRAILALSDRVQQNSIEGALKLESTRVFGSTRVLFNNQTRQTHKNHNAIPSLCTSSPHLIFTGLVLDLGVQVMVGALRVPVQVVDKTRGVDDGVLHRMACTVVCGRCCSRLLLRQH